MPMKVLHRKKCFGEMEHEKNGIEQRLINLALRRRSSFIPRLATFLEVDRILTEWRIEKGIKNLRAVQLNPQIAPLVIPAQQPLSLQIISGDKIKLRETPLSRAQHTTFLDM
jgi:hypothetical protein